MMNCVIHTTYRIVDLNHKGNVGLTAATIELAEIGRGNLVNHPDSVFVIEQTRWDDKLNPKWSVIVKRSIGEQNADWSQARDGKG